MNLAVVFAFLKTLSSTISSPIKTYPRSFLFLTILLWQFEGNLISQQIANFLFCSALVFFICVIAKFIKRFSQKGSMCFLGFSHVIIYFLAFLNLFLYFFFDCNINANILLLISETNPSESSEFVTTYLFTGKFLLLCSAFILYALLEALSLKLIKKFKSKQDCIFWKWSNQAISLYVLLSIVTLVFYGKDFSLDFQRDWRRANRSALHFMFPFKTFEAFSQFLQERNVFEICARSNENLNATSSVSPPQTIVVIIGESFNRHHSSLYGYPLPTSPKLSQLKNLFIFDNAIAPTNATSDAFRHFLSIASIDDSCNWNEKPLFPAFFKAAGYNVIFYSNQFVKEANMTTWDASCGFFNHPQLAPKLFTHRNKKKFQYDGDLLEEYNQDRLSLETDSLDLIMIHLLGQHIAPERRFPPNRAFFKIEDYSFRNELSDEQKRDVAAYDNATRYNDSIVYEIIRIFEDKNALVIYFADHGDEAHDYRVHTGRTYGIEKIGAPALHCQLDVPFLIWISDSWKTEHPDDSLRFAQHRHTPFITDDLPHILFDVANLKTEYYRPSLNPLSDSFNISRKRVIQPNASKPMDYDSVCNRFGPWKIGFKS